MKILFQYTLKNSIGITWCVLKIVLVFTNIRPCKPPLNLLFLIAGLRSSGCYLFFFLIFFSSLFMGSWYIMCSKLLFFKLLIEGKMTSPVTVYFPNYAFNENIVMYCYHQWDVFLIYLFLRHTQIKEQVSFESWEQINFCLCHIW